MELTEALTLLTVAVGSHRSAAVVWDALTPAPPTPDLIVPRKCRRTVPGVTVRRLDLGVGEIRERQGLRVTSPLRTALDCGRRLALAESVPIIDALLHARRLEQSTLVTTADRARGPGARLLRAAVAASEPAGSPLESAARLLFRAEGLAVVSQHRLHRDSHAFDFALLAYRLLIEIEGFAFHATRDQLDRDARHASEAAKEGWWLLRFTWEDIMLRPEQTIATIRRAMAEAALTLGAL